MIRAFSALVLVSGICLVGNAQTKDSVGAKIVEFCAKQKGEQVGNGECSALAGLALKSVNMKGRGKDDPNEGDYTWGRLILTVESPDGMVKVTGKPADVQPGDIIQFRDTKWAGKEFGKPNRTYTMTMPHHTAVVANVQGGGRILGVYHQNYRSMKVVQEGILQIDHLKEGWIRVYRPVAK